MTLRPWGPDDLPGLYAGFGDPDVLRFSWPAAEPYTEVSARWFLEEQEQEQGRRCGTRIHWALTGPGLLGGASLYDVNRGQGTAAVGYWLAAGARGRGHATTAVRLIAAWAFHDLGLARLELTCGPDNEASQRVARRAGFVREGLLPAQMPVTGGRRDTVLFSLLPSDLDRVPMVVDGECFDVRPRPGAYDVTWLSGPNDGYGFSASSSGHRLATRSEMATSIRNFLAQIDTETGYID